MAGSCEQVNEPSGSISEYLMNVQLFRKFFAVMEHKVHNRNHKGPPLGTILSQLNPLHIYAYPAKWSSPLMFLDRHFLCISRFFVFGRTEILFVFLASSCLVTSRTLHPSFLTHFSRSKYSLKFILNCVMHCTLPGLTLTNFISLYRMYLYVPFGSHNKQ